MSRSATDATRFTATSPHAYTKPTSINRAPPSTYSASSTSRSNPTARLNPFARTPPPPIDPKKGNAPPAETPAEKVARLREARLRERAAQLTIWDRVVIRGRRWADTAHKVTVLGIVGFSIVTAGITAFSLTDMVLHNRRKRAAFYAEQHNIYGQRLLEAIEAEKAGLPLDEDQTLVLNRERARVQAEEAAKLRTWGKSIRGLLTGGLKTEKEEDEAAAAEGAVVVIPSEGEILERLGVDSTTILKRAAAAGQTDKDSSGSGPGSTTTDFDNNSRGEEGTEKENGSRILHAVAEKNRRGEGERVVTDAAGISRGGPLDQMAEGAAQAVEGRIHAAEEKARSSSNGSWTSWWSGK